ncbi:calcium/calmodulin-dependent 3',5'-cyclic nucleotide phosphodiesterase 1A-like isoform X2 [Xenia sp. Carnegie-2017]|uniref:calcium/calmodulin-dependent 3',5'-cyclic nucleotide phosphodiesterase 1A-like isoform X2 n=1 Tax=Xenia sp. Carnegie-2017 TaxID=2897299 RepID=UPI001F0376CC|nr:calcium/calmodulin-dependent 3',5'-cyclic nucleotide phosphodiesterase 1A-like isoform X2 [Xenia sp. Carnegie-2017]
MFFLSINKISLEATKAFSKYHKYKAKAKNIRQESQDSTNNGEPIHNEIEDDTETMSAVIVAERLRRTLKSIEKGIYPDMDDLHSQLTSVSIIMDSMSASEEERFLTGRQPSIAHQKENSECGDFIPKEVQKWLTATFTTQFHISKSLTRNHFKFKQVISAVRCSLYVEKMYKDVCGIRLPSDVEQLLQTVDNWTCDVLEIDEVSERQALRFVALEIFSKFSILEKFNIPWSMLDHFLHVVQDGYQKYPNAYHNHCHAAEVLQTVHFMLMKLDAAAAFSDLQIFAFLFAAMIHDYEHTGKTNLYHINTRSELAMMYNDRSVQENHHISAAFGLLNTEEINILVNLNSGDYSEFRSLVIEMVLGTDMSKHFEELKTVKARLVNNNISSFDPTKCMPFVLHCADIGHPAKEWSVHKKWADRVMEEFFEQGDIEKNLGLPLSPLCDRKTTVIPESQVSFINIILAPSLDLCGDVLDRLRQFRGMKLSESNRTLSNKIQEDSLKKPMPDNSDKKLSVKKVLTEHLRKNRKRWQELCQSSEQT